MRNLAHELQVLIAKDDQELSNIVAEVILAFPNEVASLKGGRNELINFLVGQVMKKSHGQLNPQDIKHEIAQQLTID